MAPNGRISASVIVPAYNCRYTIEACLRSLSAQHSQEAYEIILADSSTDQTPEIVREQFPSIKLLHSPRRLSPSLARNAGLGLAQGDYILFLDSDCRVGADWLQAMLCRLREGYWGVGGSFGVSSWRRPIFAAHHLMEFFRFLPGRKSALAVTAILSGNCGYKRQVFEKEAFPPAPWAEDILLSSRLRRQGKSLIFDPAICALHQPQFSLSEIIKRQYALGRAAAWVRTQIPLRGKIFTQWPYLGIFLPLVNLTTIALELFFSRPAYFFLFILLSPLCLVLNIAWTLGFMRHFFNPQ